MAKVLLDQHTDDGWRETYRRPNLVQRASCAIIRAPVPDDELVWDVDEPAEDVGRVGND